MIAHEKTNIEKNRHKAAKGVTFYFGVSQNIH